jgi:DNA-binding HxlR family transcriptional regulator
MVINRVVIPGSRPLQTEYSVTEKGKMMEPMLEFLAEFSKMENNGTLKEFSEIILDYLLYMSIKKSSKFQ